MIEILTSLESNSNLPEKAHETDACADLTATSITLDKDYIEYGTGLKMLPPKGYFGLVFPRSSVSKYDLVLANSVGMIDEYTGEWKVRFKRLKKPVLDSLYNLFETKRNRFIEKRKYCESLSFINPIRNRVWNEIQVLKADIEDIDKQIQYMESFEKLYQLGDKIAQIMFLPKIEWSYQVVDKLPETVRGSGSFGSTNKKKHGKKQV